MAVFTGQDGVLVFNAQTQVRVRNWSFTSNVDTLETTDLGDEHVATAQFENRNGYLHDHVPQRQRCTTKHPCHRHHCCKRNPNLTLLELRWDGKDLDFNAFITSVNVTCSVGEVATADLSPNDR